MLKESLITKCVSRSWVGYADALVSWYVQVRYYIETFVIIELKVVFYLLRPLVDQVIGPIFKIKGVQSHNYTILRNIFFIVHAIKKTLKCILKLFNLARNILRIRCTWAGAPALPSYKKHNMKMSNYLQK
jgi:hypothetical protein